MPHRLFATSENAVLSPARQALRDHFAAIAGLHVRVDQLSLLVRQAAEADAAEAEAQQAVNAVADAEEARLSVWSDNPSGPIPAPLTGQREAALSKLADAHRSAISSRRQAEAVQPRIHDLMRKRSDLSERSTSLIDAVLMEEAVSIARQYYDTVALMNAGLSALNGIFAAFRQRGSGRAMETISALIGGGPDGAAREQRQRGLARHNALVINEWSKLGERLAEDPHASIELASYVHSTVRAERGAA
jgi:hypothetical protein